MYEAKDKTGFVTSPVKFKITDSLPQKLLKAVASTMISFDPGDRPTIEDVLSELQSITGTVCKSLHLHLKIKLDVMIFFMKCQLQI